MNSASGTAARRILTLTVIIALAGIYPLALPADAAIPGSFCQDPTAITGMGSTTQIDLHRQIFVPTYEEVCQPAIGLVDYQGPGSAHGINAALTHDNGYTFYTSDLALTSIEKVLVEMDVVAARGRTLSIIHHFPIALNGFTLGYNLSGCDSSQPLHLNSEVVSLIYMGHITKWNDPLIVLLNPHLLTCSLSIEPSVRAETAASNLYFKDFMSQRNPAWNAYKTHDTNTSWPPTLVISCRGIGDVGMATCLMNPGSIGYLPYQVAHTYGVQSALLRNRSGAFVGPASDPSNVSWPDNCPAAAASSNLPSNTKADWGTTTLSDPANGYAFCAFTYVFAFQAANYASGPFVNGQMRNTVDYLTTAVGNLAQPKTKDLGYAPLPTTVRTMVKQGIDGMTEFFST